MTETPYFNAPRESWPWGRWPEEGSEVFQVWFEDAESMRVKYEGAIAHVPGLGGFGVWHLDSVSYASDGGQAAESGRMIRALLRSFGGAGSPVAAGAGREDGWGRGVLQREGAARWPAAAAIA